MHSVANPGTITIIAYQALFLTSLFEKLKLMLVVICVLSDARDFLLIHECIQTRFWAFVLHVVLGSTSVASLLLVLLHSRKKGCPIRNGGMGAENQCLHCHESQRCILPHREDTHTAIQLSGLLTQPILLTTHTLGGRPASNHTTQSWGNKNP